MLVGHPAKKMAGRLPLIRGGKVVSLERRICGETRKKSPDLVSTRAFP